MIRCVNARQLDVAAYYTDADPVLKHPIQSHMDAHTMLHTQNTLNFNINFKCM